MKILHVYRDLFSEGGIPYQTRCLVKAQARLGHNVTIIALSGELKGSFENQNPAISCFVISWGWKGLCQLRNILRKSDPDIVHVTGLWLPIHQLWILEIVRAGVPYVVSPHGGLSPYGMMVRFGGKKQNIFHILAKRIWHRCMVIPLLKYAKGIHVHSKYEAELIRATEAAKVFIAPIGVDSTWLRPSQCGPRKLHQPITLLHLGRLDIYHKGLDLVVDALKDLVNAGRQVPVKVIFVGPAVNNSREVLEKQAAQLGPGILEIRGPLWGKEKDVIWEEADYFLNLYRFAGMAIAPSEAIARGIPLIASREGNFGDWTECSSMGFLLPLYSQFLKEKIAKILQVQEKEYQGLSENALRFSRIHSWDRIAKVVIEGYDRVLQ